jgi:hypothetical protein
VFFFFFFFLSGAAAMTTVSISFRNIPTELYMCKLFFFFLCPLEEEEDEDEERGMGAERLMALFNPSWRRDIVLVTYGVSFQVDDSPLKKLMN